MWRKKSIGNLAAGILLLNKVQCVYSLDSFTTITIVIILYSKFDKMPTVPDILHLV